MIKDLTLKQALVMKEQALQKRVTATYKNPVRKEFDLGEAFALEKESIALLTPVKPLKRGLGDEIVPPLELGHSGLEETLQQPDLLDCEVTIKRTRLADEAGVFEMAIETAESTKAKGSVQKMISHQLAAAHHHAMRLLGEADRQKDPLIKCKLMNTSTRLMEAFSKGALTLQKLQTGANQIVTVQHVSVNGSQAIIEELKQAYLEGHLKYKLSQVDGIKNAPNALIGLLKGQNFGKQVVKLI